MEAKRIDGIKYHVDKLTDPEVTGIYGHLVEKHTRLLGDIAFLETVMLGRIQPELPFDEPDLAGYAEVADLNRWDDMGTY